MIKIIDKKTNYSIADYNAIDNIKALALDIAECFNKEISYNNYSCSYILYLLYTKFLNYDLNNLSWINQDQFITNLDISFLIKSIKFMCNFISLEELKQNKLEYCKHNLSYAVGCCLKEKYLNDKYIINKKKSLISYYMKLSIKSRQLKSIIETLVEFYIQLGFYNLVHNLVLNNYGHILSHLYSLQQYHNHLD